MYIDTTWFFIGMGLSFLLGFIVRRILEDIFR